MASEQDNNWCLDLDGLCMVEDPKLIEAEGEETPRSILPNKHSEEDIEAQRSRRSVSRERKSEPPRLDHDCKDKKKKEKRRHSTKDDKRNKEDPPAKRSSSFISSLSRSFTGSDKKSKSVTTKLETTKEKKDTAFTDSDTDETHVDRNTGREINADVFMISGCQDSQTSADVSNVSSFSLPDPNGKAGGACTSALLKVLYSNRSSVTDLTFVQVLSKMRKILRKGRYSQIPQLTSAKEMDVSQKFYIVPPDCQGTKRAVLIGINYVGQNGELSGCHNDCKNMKDYIMDVWGFKEENITVLMDDGYHPRPTRANILDAYKEVVYGSSSGDAVFCHYSGHGGRVRDDDYGEEEDGYDETLVPVDYSSAGQIRDDDLYDKLVSPMASGVTLVSLMDCCHSATVLDLPYKYKATSSGEYQIDPLSLDGGNAMITACLCGMVIVILVVVLPIMLVNN